MGKSHSTTLQRSKSEASFTFELKYLNFRLYENQCLKSFILTILGAKIQMRVLGDFQIHQFHQKLKPSKVQTEKSYLKLS